MYSAKNEALLAFVYRGHASSEDSELAERQDKYYRERVLGNQLCDVSRLAD